ncbi:MAG: copper amine oxidase N-terminal domain-containing protein, partial [Syntrophomonadaceae bacterium]|nr:copper amine oxidase N-terminal domain-containing protein [Syntrophomonadaceae bacterium]
ARSRKLSLVLVLAMLMTMFAGLGTASAATGYSASHVPLVEAGPNANLGAIIVSFDNLPKADDPNGFIVKLPASFKLANNSFGTAAGAGPVYLVDISAGVIKGENVAVYAKYILGTNQATITVYNNHSTVVPELKFAIDLKNITVPDGAPEDINASIIAQPGSVFSDGIVQVAKTTDSGAVTALAGDAITVTGSGSADPVVINFRENKKEALGNFTLKLPKGFSWDTNTTIVYEMSTMNVYFTPVAGTDSRTVKFTRNAGMETPGIWKFQGKVEVDESVAEFGDIEVAIGGSSNVSPSSVVIGKYADYGIEIEVDDPETEVLAGRNEQTVSTFAFKELLSGSLLNDRTIYVELPSGVRWHRDYDPKTDTYAAGDPGPWLKKTGGLDNTTIQILPNDPDTLKLVIKKSGTSKGKLELKDAKVQVAGDFTGDITAKIWGNAGISEEIVIGTVVAPISVTADVVDVKIGLQKQAAGNIVITETKAEAIESHVYGVSNPVPLVVELPFAVTWGNIPTVKVIEGDIELGTVSVNKQELNIPIKNSSSKASKIEISDVTYTVDRTVPEGDMVAEFKGAAIVQSNFTNRNYVVEEVLANCVTPAPGETIGSGEFRIGSNIYYEGGVAKVMDVAPYIKSDRTYVPMRYLGEILGAEVVWDDAARTVTLT